MKWITLLTIFFYNTIKGMVRNVLPALGVPEDILMLIIGWFLSKRTGVLADLGEGLIYGAVASLGASGGIAIGGLFGGGAKAQEVDVVAEEAVQY
jgi:hypothetical protein